MIKINKNLLPCALIAASTFLYSGHTLARIVCWTNSDGVRECGDKVPPEASQKKREELNKQGLVVEEHERAKTQEELEKEKEMAAKQAEEERKIEEREKMDEILLSTFTSVDEIEVARDDKLEAIESSIDLANTRNEKMQKDMDGLLEKAAAAETSGEEPSKHLLEDIATLERQINNNNKFIKDKRTEQEEIKDAYAVDIERFKNLKGIEE